MSQRLTDLKPWHHDNHLILVLPQVHSSYLENPEEAELNAKHLIAILNDAVNHIFMSTDSCPQ